MTRVALALLLAAALPASAQDEEEAPQNPIELETPLPEGTPMRRMEDRGAQSGTAIRAPVRQGPSYAAPSGIREARDDEAVSRSKPAQGVGTAIQSGGFARPLGGTPKPAAGASSASSAGTGTGSGASSSGMRGNGAVHVTDKLPPELAKVRWVNHDRGIRHMDEYIWGKAHPIVRISGPGIGHAIAFQTKANERDSYLCGVANTPKAKMDSGCVMNVWISEWPSHEPIQGCGQFDMGVQPLTVTGAAMSPADAAQASRPGAYRGCVLKLGTYYYCNYAPTGWDRQDEFKPSSCDGAFNGYIGAMDETMQPPTARR